jgi:hypothetical protein
MKKEHYREKNKIKKLTLVAGSPQDSGVVVQNWCFPA